MRYRDDGSNGPLQGGAFVPRTTPPLNLSGGAVKQFPRSLDEYF